MSASLISVCDIEIATPADDVVKRGFERRWVMGGGEWGEVGVILLGPGLK